VNGAPVITVRGLRKAYGDREVVRGIDFEVGAGEVFGLLGANGAGKTTTIEILEGYRTRTSGHVRVLGLDPARPTRGWRDRIGLVLQEGGLSPLLTVHEVLTMYAELFSRPREPRSTIELVGLGQSADIRVGQLSGGQRRRLEVAVALIGDPQLVFLDEPTTGFDPSARREAWGMIDELRRLGTTVLLTTHYMDEAQSLADRVAILREGRIVAQGPPAELATDLAEVTLVTFRTPPGAAGDELAAHVDGVVEFDGEAVTIRTPHAQRTLYLLTAWAEGQGVVLEALEARRPSLEDVFLEVTREAVDV
jgi:ABC-2 type transport system ATP-binding protein